ncbi:MAG: response regulator transcription factor [Armatimonadota bacterium]
MALPEENTRILIIDDEEQIRRALKSLLAVRKYQVLLAEHGQQGLELAAEHAPDLVILDLMMPGMSGLEVCRELRGWYTGPILILSVRGNETDKIAALDLGADDYLTKPFHTGELLARIRALLRRATGPTAPSPVVHVGGLEIDLARRIVTRDSEPVSLTPTEYDILAYLAQHPNRVVTTSMLLAQVWGADPGDDTQTLRSHISHLRQKIEANPKMPVCLLTEPGVGFRFVIPE